MIYIILGVSEVDFRFRNIQRTIRKEVMEGPKYEFVTSHIMRRSFVSNYYRQIETALLKNITARTTSSKTMFKKLTILNQ